VENIGISNDGKWLGYSAGKGRTSQVYRVRLDAKGTEQQQLTSDSLSSYWTSWSPDGKEIAFHRFLGERRQAFVAQADGGAPVAVTDGSEDARSPEWSPDGQQLLLLTNWGTNPKLQVVKRDGGGKWSKPSELAIVLDGKRIAPGVADWSPDGRSLACGCGEGGIVIAPVEGGPARRLASSFSTAGWAFPQWSADGRTVYHVTEKDGRAVAIVGVPVDGGAAREVVRFDDATRPWHRYGFRVRAGRIFLTLGERESDVWVVDIEKH
jgi:Tol biopolymer transport system component